MSAVAGTRAPVICALAALFLGEARMVIRDTAGLVVPVGLPALILATSADAAGDEVIVAGRTALDLFVLPLVLVMVAALIGITNMPSFLAYYRRTGILRRLAVTPVSPGLVLAAQALVSLVQALLGMAVALLVAVIAFGARPPVEPVVAAVVIAATMAAMYAVGMVVAAVAPTPNSSVAIGLVLFLGLGALGGMLGGRDALPAPLAALGELSPFGAAVDALSAAWAGAAVEPSQWIVLGVTMAIGGVVSAALFRWE